MTYDAILTIRREADAFLLAARVGLSRRFRAAPGGPWVS